MRTVTAVLMVCFLVVAIGGRVDARRSVWVNVRNSTKDAWVWATGYNKGSPVISFCVNPGQEKRENNGSYVDRTRFEVTEYAGCRHPRLADLWSSSPMAAVVFEIKGDRKSGYHWSSYACHGSPRC